MAVIPDALTMHQNWCIKNTILRLSCNSYGATRLGCFYVTAILSWGNGWGWAEVDIEAEVELSSLVEIYLRLSWVGVEISWHWIKEEIGLS